MAIPLLQDDASLFKTCIDHRRANSAHARRGHVGVGINEWKHPRSMVECAGYYGNQIMPGGKMLSQSSKKSIPPLVTDRRRLIPQQRGLNIVRLPPVLLRELPHELLPDLGVSRPCQAASKICHGHGTVAGHGASSDACGCSEHTVPGGAFSGFKHPVQETSPASSGGGRAGL